MTAPDVFRRVVHALDAAGIPYMLTGSFASAYHAVPRATQDIDLVIAPDRNRLAELARTFSAPAVLLRRCRRARGPRAGTEFARRRRVEFDGLNLYVAAAEDVLLSKLEWAKLGESGRQLEDAAWLLRRRGDDLDRAYIERWARELQVGEQWQAARRLAGRLG